jgi:hypothetical protein
VAKPFAAAFEDESKEPLWALDFLDDTIQTSTAFITYHKTIERIAMNPSRYAELFNLYGGDSYPPLPETISAHQYPLPESALKFPFDVDVMRIHVICTYNRFGFNSVNDLATFGRPKPKKNKLKTTPAGLYLFPSYFNHSCVPNAEREQFGEAMVIRATRNIAKRDEIFLSYMGTSSDYEERKNTLKRWIAVCDCELCRCDREAGDQKLAKRQELYKQSSDRSIPINQSRQIAKQLDDTYLPGHGTFRLEAAKGHHRLALALASQDCNSKEMLKEVIQEEMNALDRLGILVIDKKMTMVQPKKDSNKSLPIATDHAPYDSMDPVMFSLTIVEMFFNLGIFWRAENWMRAAVWCK